MDRKIVYIQFAKFLEQEILENEGKNDDICESLSVAKECIESAKGITEEEKKRSISVDLFQLISSKLGNALSPSEKQKADSLKFQGNKCLQANLLQEAIECYTQAIEIDPSDAVYYCNRAAAYTNNEMYELAIGDCVKALNLNPNYGKAYGRLGLVHANQNNFKEAARCYSKAIELDPTNDSYKQNLSMAESKINASEGSGSNTGGSANLDFSSLLSNPALLNIAGQLLSNTQMRDQMAGMVNSYFGNQQQENPTPNNPVDMDSMLRMGQEFAQQMASVNPELVETLRDRFQNNQGSDGGGGKTSNQPEEEPPQP